MVRWNVDPDLWGHVRFGMDVVRHRALADVDPFSFASDIRWMNHEWLSEALLGLAYLAGGVPVMLLLKIAVVGGSYALMAWRLRAAPDAARWWLLTVAMLALSATASTWRPHLWTVLALTVLFTTHDWPMRRRMFLWPLIFAAWANLHGGWIVGIGTLAAWATGVVVARRDPRAIVMFILCLLATLGTPYGFDLWRFMWRTVGFGRPGITEWQSIWWHATQYRNYVPIVMWALTTAAAYLVLRRTTCAWSDLLPVAMLAVASARVVRLEGLYAVAVVTLLGYRLRGSPAPSVPRPLLAMIATVAAVLVAVMAREQIACVPMLPDRHAPDLHAAGAFASPRVRGRIVVPFNLGEYVIWHFGPRLRVSLDGRRETVYSQAALDAQRGGGDGLQLAPFIARHRPEYAWLPRPEWDPLRAYLVERGYRQDVVTRASVILTREDLPVVSEPIAPMPACFY